MLHHAAPAPWPPVPAAAATALAPALAAGGGAHEARGNPLLVLAEAVPEGPHGRREGARPLGVLRHHRAAGLELLHEIHGLALAALFVTGEALAGVAADRILHRLPEPFLIGIELQAGLDGGYARIHEAVEVILRQTLPLAALLAGS